MANEVTQDDRNGVAGVKRKKVSHFTQDIWEVIQKLVLRWQKKKKRQWAECYDSQTLTEFLLCLGFFVFALKWKWIGGKWQWEPKWILTPPNGHLRSEPMRSTEEVASGESQISNKAGFRGSPRAEPGEMEVFVYNPRVRHGNKEMVGKGVYRWACINGEEAQNILEWAYRNKDH